MPYKQPGGFIEYCKNWEAKIGAFIEFRPDAPECLSPEDRLPEKIPASSLQEGLPAAACLLPEEGLAQLSGLPCAVKDNIAVKGFSLSCGSKLLADLKSPYTATAVRKLREAGAAVIGKTNMDEFGMGSSTDNSALQKTNNPWDTNRVSGGSSGGSAAAVAAGLVPFALGSDTGGSVRQPAAFCGVVGLKPTYGAVSRYGLVAYASSLEGIGILADTAKRARAVFAAIRGKDPMDDTSRNAPKSAPSLYSVQGVPSAAGKTGIIGVLSPEAVAKTLADFPAGKSGEKTEEAARIAAAEAAEAAALEPEVRRGFDLAGKCFTALGWKLVDVEIPSLKYGVPAYYTIAAAEASANLARFDGVRYGRRPAYTENPDELVDKTREDGFGNEVKLRILLGTFVLRSGFQDRYYLRAQRIRAGIRSEFEALLGKDLLEESPLEGDTPCVPRMDAILLPVFPTRAFGRGPNSLSSFAQKAADLYTCCANLAGLPAVSFPASLEGGLPVGVQLLGRSFSEGLLLDMVEAYEKARPFPHPPGYQRLWG